MSGFKWEVFEPAEDAASTLHGGTVQLDDIKAVSMTTRQWVVKPPDESVPLVPQASGEVQLIDRVRSNVSQGVVNFALIVLVVVIAFIIVNETMLGSLSYEKFLLVTLLGLDIADRHSSKKK